MEQTELRAGQEATQGFGEQSLVRQAETSSTALAEQAKAAVSARYIVAERRPRNMERAREVLLKDCSRPRFADAAIYNKPVGDGIEGPSIRLAEAAARALGNIYSEVMAVFDDASKRIVRITATDLESNLTYFKDVTIEKTIERSKPMPGRKVLGTRKNSRGYDVFILDATSDEILDKENALTSKALRTVLLRLVPGDLTDEAIQQCYRTINQENEKDLPGARKRMVAEFDRAGVSVEQLADYFGHAVDNTSLQEMSRAKSVLNALKEKETTWAEVMDFVRQQRGSAPTTQETGSSGGNVDDRLANKAAAAKGDAAKTVETTAEVKPKSNGTKQQSRFEE